jgi:hypothetical protein
MPGDSRAFRASKLQIVVSETSYGFFEKELFKTAFGLSGLLHKNELM